MREAPSPLSLLWKYIRTRKGRVAALATLYILSAALFIAAPRALSRFIDSARAGDTASAVLLAILLYLAAILLREAANCALNSRLAALG